MGRIRVCELITELAPAGAERCVYELARRLDPARFEVHVAALRGGAVAEKLREAGLGVHVIGLRGKWDLPRLVRLPRLLRRIAPDLLHTHLFHADLAGRPAARLAGVPHVVHTVHVVELRFRPWRFAWARLAAGLCERIVCVSQAVRDQHARRTGLPASGYEVIPNGIDAARYARDEAARSRLRRRWGVGPDEPLAAFVGRLHEQKGVDTLLAAMDLLTERGEGLPLVIAGDGPQRGLVEASAAVRSGRARFLGRVDDVPAVLSAADLLAMPSRWEGLPLTAVEAMAAGLPVVAARAPGLTEVVTAEVGLLVEPDDPSALAAAMLRLARDAELRARLGETGVLRARTLFDVDRNVRAHERLYEALCAEPPHAHT